MEIANEIEQKLEKKFSKNFNEKWEQSFILLMLFLFIILGVLFFVFAIPKISPALPAMKEKMQNNAVVNQEESDPAKNYSAGVKLAGDMNYSAALSYFQKAVEKDPKNVNYLTELALTQYHLKDYDGAIKTYDALLQIDNANGSSYYNRIGNIYWIRKEYVRAEFFFRKAIENNSRLSVSYSNLAIMLNEQGRKDEAIEILKKGIVESEGGSDLKTTLLIIESSK